MLPFDLHSMAVVRDLGTVCGGALIAGIFGDGSVAQLFHEIACVHGAPETSPPLTSQP